jgi:methylated-DNA-[protein]-cysteine S-methyltransferase
LQSGNPPDYLPVFIEEMNAYFGGNLKIFNTPVDWNVLVPFDRTVLSIVGNIPYGMVDTYGQIAEKMGLPFGARAIGGVMARNPLPIILPCHRVIGADGHLRGYGGPGGISTKKWLLQLEGVYLV